MNEQRYREAEAAFWSSLGLVPQERFVELASTGTPVRVLWGTADPFGGTQVAQRFTARFADADLHLLPGAGHAPWMDDPSGCATRIASFLGT